MTGLRRAPAAPRRAVAAALLAAAVAHASPTLAQKLPAFVDPFAPDRGPLACEDIFPAFDREKFGFSADCAGAPAAAAEQALGAAALGGFDLPSASASVARAPAAGGREPMRRADIPDLFRRVLSLPGARLSAAPGAAGDAAELPSFTVLHVYAEQTHGADAWYEVGRGASGGVDGWLPASAAEEWRTMLVMRYAPPGTRGRVLFFKQQEGLQRLIEDDHLASEVELLHEEVREGAHDPDYLVAIEPSLGVDPAKPYLMPILRHKRALTALATPVQMLEVAGLNLVEGAALQADPREVEDLGVPSRARELRDFDIGVVFLIDTTSSMGPYIDDTRAIVGSTLSALSDAGTIDRFSFGLIGYRDNVEAGANVEYVTRVYQPLQLGTAPNDLMRNFSLMRPAAGSTQGFSEDAFAGLHTALNAMDWSQFEARLVVLITDAGARAPLDPRAAVPGYGAPNVIEDAARLGVAVTVIHLVTPEGIRAGNVEEALTTYRSITRTGDLGLDKYLPVDTREPASFRDQITSFQQALVGATEQLSKARTVRATESDAAPGGDGALGAVLVNEVFRAQLEYLGAKEGQEAPRFYRAWAADRDLSETETPALEVKAFLTRNQLAQLSAGVERIMAAYLRQQTSGGDFFDAMQAIAAETSVEGAQSGGGVEAAGQLLPSFLSALPYRSPILALDRVQWSAMQGGRQQAVIDTLQSKLRAYRDVAQEQQGWIDLGAGDKGLEAYPLSLSLLP